MEEFLLQATICLSTMVIAVPLAARPGRGRVRGCLVAGIQIGPAGAS